MFVHYSLRNNVSYQAIAMLVVAALLTWTVGAQFLGKSAEAANVTNFSDQLSDSRASVGSNHTITFTTPTGMAIGETFTVEFETGDFGTGAIVLGDVDLSDDAADQTLAGAAAAGTWGVTGFGSDTLTFETPTDTAVGAGSVMVVTIGTNATGGTNQITNPAATTTSYTIDIGGTMTDSGQTRVAITDNVLVTAEVATTFDFVVNGTPTGFTIPGVATTTASTTNSSALPFGELTADTSVTLAHQLNVTTNAANGFVVTVEQTGDLQSSTGAVIDSFTDGSYENNPAANTSWVHPGDNIAQDNTWGHWGLTSDDDSFNGGTNDGWVAASTTPRTVFTHASSSDGVTNDIGSTTVGYQIEITPLQEAGNDYTTNLIYIATPTF